ncbi:MAG: glycosyltransferase family 4 protein [Melioribacteraceae bacterium]|nr:glycosyltransferase family 4 protein [Melioribacteraceae bacterium]MCF8431169.1 glycosyltransferase family 4 protein [Melioribacteraceae bacterium]
MKSLLIFGRYHSKENLVGSEKLVKRYFENWPRSEYEVIFIDFFFGYKLSILADKLFGRENLQKGKNAVFVRLGLVRIIQLILNKKPKSILVTGLEGYATAAIFAKLFVEVNIFYLVNGLYRFELKESMWGKDRWFFKLKNKILESLLIHKADKLIVMSDSVKQQLSDIYKIKLTKVLLHKLGVDEVFFSLPLKNKISKEFQIIYTGGHGRELKGFSFLIEVLNELRFPVQLSICGPVESVANFEDDCAKFGSHISYKYLGFLNAYQLAEAYNDQNLFILPSKYETFSIATLEAMAAGLTVIVSQSAGASRFVVNGENGILFEFGDNKKLAAILKDLHQNAMELSPIRVKARYSMEEFRWKNVTSELLDSLRGNK